LKNNNLPLPIIAVRKANDKDKSIFMDNETEMRSKDLQAQQALIDRNKVDISNQSEPFILSYTPEKKDRRNSSYIAPEK
jgi:hypothetical protein